MLSRGEGSLQVQEGGGALPRPHRGGQPGKGLGRDPCTKDGEGAELACPKDNIYIKDTGINVML